MSAHREEAGEAKRKGPPRAFAREDPSQPSGRQDLNLRPLDPQECGLPGLSG